MRRRLTPTSLYLIRSHAVAPPIDRGRFLDDGLRAAGHADCDAGERSWRPEGKMTKRRLLCLISTCWRAEGSIVALSTSRQVDCYFFEKINVAAVLRGGDLRFFARPETSHLWNRFSWHLGRGLLWSRLSCSLPLATQAASSIEKTLAFLLKRSSCRCKKVAAFHGNVQRTRRCFVPSVSRRQHVRNRNAAQKLRQRLIPFRWRLFNLWVQIVYVFCCRQSLHLKTQYHVFFCRTDHLCFIRFARSSPQVSNGRLL